jgi:hypothetical protein
METEVLEFDHLGNKLFNISQCAHLYVRSMTDEEAQHVLRVELEKCQVLCRFHHQIKSAKDHRKRADKKRKSDDEGTAKQIHSRKYAREKRMFNKQHVMSKKLKVGQCGHCPRIVTIDNTSGFDFDHLDRKTKHCAISRMATWRNSIEIIDKEIEKCMLLCANCHFRKTMTKDVKRLITQYKN